MNVQKPVVRILALCAVVGGIFCSSIATANADTGLGQRRMTLAEFARTRATTRVPSQRFEARAAFGPQKTFPELRPFSNLYLLYVSAIAPSGAGTVNVYPGWSRSPHPPLLRQIVNLASPTGLAVDAFGTLYVVQTEVGAPVLVFRFGSTVASLKLDTAGTLPVAVAVSPAGTVFVSTARTNTSAPQILVYPRGATKPTARYGNLAGDAVVALQCDELGNVYYAADFIGYGNYIGEITTGAAGRLLVRLDGPANGLVLDRTGNIVAQVSTLSIYAHQTGTLMRNVPIGFSQAIGFNADDSTLITAGGTINRYAYPSGIPIDSITSLGNTVNTFGVATFPAAPYAQPW